MPNRLAHETSPYLLQHQHNPVDWYPWGEEAFARARAEDRPILLSVGYSACHWCHVMERESFEDEATARAMNQGFVNIKVDREERPDVDEIYMRAVQAFTGGHGGWPMTVFLTPDRVPFFAGTYFPPFPRPGMPSFAQVLEHCHRIYHHDKDALARVTTDIQRYLDEGGRLPGPSTDAATDWLATIATAAARDFDATRGGFGGAPKFPPHATLSVLLAHHQRSGDTHSLAMVTETLDAMALGGMFDLIGGGFARYSVDADWRVPHFEKMLYDNALLLPVTTDAWRLTGREAWARVVRQTVGFLLSELRDPAGGFWSALDADSEGEEGRFYVWTPDQLRDALADSDVDADRVAGLLQVTRRGSFEHGSSVLRLSAPFDTLPADDQLLLDEALPLLRQARSRRVRPGLDDKVLTAWNALAISGLARAASAFDQPSWHQAAVEAATFLLGQVTVDGRLMRTWKATAGGGRAHIPGFADDHAFLVAALLDLYAGDFDPRWLRAALDLADRLVDLFWDDADGGLFYTGSDAEPLITRSKHMLGGAVPSANGVAALALARLSTLTGRTDLAEKARAIVSRYRMLLDRAPRALGPEALAAAWLTGPTREIGIVGQRDADDTAALLAELRRRPLPFSVIARVDPDADADTLSLLPWMAERVHGQEQATAYVCEGSACQLPARTPAALARRLNG